METVEEQVHDDAPPEEVPPLIEPGDPGYEGPVVFADDPPDIDDEPVPLTAAELAAQEDQEQPTGESPTQPQPNPDGPEAPSPAQPQPAQPPVQQPPAPDPPPAQPQRTAKNTQKNYFVFEKVTLNGDGTQANPFTKGTKGSGDQIAWIPLGLFTGYSPTKAIDAYLDSAGRDEGDFAAANERGFHEESVSYVQPEPKKVRVRK